MNESRATRYQRRRRLGRAFGLLLAAVALGLMAFTAFGSWLAELAQAVARAAPGGVQPAVALVIFVASVCLLLEVARLPARLLPIDSGRDRRSHPGGLPAAAVLATEAQLLIGFAAAATYAAAVVQISVWSVGPDWWWLLAGIGIAAGLLLAVHAAPALVSALAGATPLGSAELADRLARLSRQAGVPLDRVEEVPAHQGDEATAFVAGLGRRRRVFLASTLVRDWREDEIAVVVAHELGHHRRGDLWRTLALDAALLVGGLGLASLVRISGAAPGSLAALPGVAWIAGAVWVASTPLRHAQSRHHERLADAFALALTGGADAFARVVRRLGARHLADERPSAWTRWMTLRHPSVAERLAAAEAHRLVEGGAARQAKRARVPVD
jgi:STE24 endopeptidase